MDNTVTVSWDATGRKREQKRENMENNLGRKTEEQKKRKEGTKEGGGDERGKNIQWLDWIEFLFGFNENVVFVFE